MAGQMRTLLAARKHLAGCGIGRAALEGVTENLRGSFASQTVRLGHARRADETAPHVFLFQGPGGQGRAHAAQFQSLLMLEGAHPSLRTGILFSYPHTLHPWTKPSLLTSLEPRRAFGSQPAAGGVDGKEKAERGGVGAREKGAGGKGSEAGRKQVTKAGSEDGGGAGREAVVQAEGFPVVLVTSPGQLPQSFLDPPRRVQDGGFVVGLDCEGVKLSREGRLCVLEVIMGGVVYLIDVVEGGIPLVEACRPALESPAVVKVIHDCKRDAEALFFQFHIKLQGVFDTQVAHWVLTACSFREEKIPLVRLLALPQYCAVDLEDKKAMGHKLKENPEYWLQRPLTEQMMKEASSDVRYLLVVHARMIAQLSAKQLLRISVHSALRARSYCCSSSEDARVLWPAPEPYPALLDEEAHPGLQTSRESLKAGEVASCIGDLALTVVDVPAHQLSRVINKGGIPNGKLVHACPTSEIFSGFPKGPEGKVFIIGSRKEGQLGEGIIQRRLKAGTP